MWWSCLFLFSCAICQFFKDYWTRLPLLEMLMAMCFYRFGKYIRCIIAFCAGEMTERFVQLWLWRFGMSEGNINWWFCKLGAHQSGRFAPYVDIINQLSSDFNAAASDLLKFFNKKLITELIWLLFPSSRRMFTYIVHFRVLSVVARKAIIPTRFHSSKTKETITEMNRKTSTEQSFIIAQSLRGLPRDYCI